MVAGVLPKWVGAFLCWDVGIFECGEIEASPQVSILPKRHEHWTRFFFCFECRDDVFIDTKHMEHILQREERVGQSVETTGYHSFSELGPSGVS